MRRWAGGVQRDSDAPGLASRFLRSALPIRVDDIRGRIAETYDEGRVRMAAMQDFLADYPEGVSRQRYVRAELPSLPFRDREFDLCVCSHFLFLYSAQLDEAFHRDSMLELCRVAREVRVFPLVTLAGTPSPFVDAAARGLGDAGYDVRIEQVPYEFQRGGNQMMRVALKQ